MSWVRRVGPGRAPTSFFDRKVRRAVERHGPDAPIHAAMRADAMLDKGDLDGCAVWKRILRAVEELQGTAPKPGEAVH